MEAGRIVGGRERSQISEKPSTRYGSRTVQGSGPKGIGSERGLAPPDAPKPPEPGEENAGAPNGVVGKRSSCATVLPGLVAPVLLTTEAVELVIRRRRSTCAASAGDAPAGAPASPDVLRGAESDL